MESLTTIGTEVLHDPVAYEPLFSPGESHHSIPLRRKNATSTKTLITYKKKWKIDDLRIDFWNPMLVKEALINLKDYKSKLIT